MNTEFKGTKVSDESKFESRDFVDYDFTKSDLTEVVFKNCNFSNCVFNRTILDHTRFWCCFFDHCRFVHTSLAITFLGAWGGGLSNCVFEKCKFGGMITGSYFIDSVFDKCKIKTTCFQTYLMKNIRFTGLLDDVSFQKFPDKDIHGYQTEEAGKRAEDRIRRIVGQAFHSKKVMLENMDFSGSRMQFVSFKDCNTKTMIAPDDGKHLLIRDMATVAQKVYTDIERNWPDENTRSWALCCTGNYLTRTTEIVSFYEFKHFENEEFAGRLMDLFRKYNVCGEN